jgi:hypothetical protein
MYPYGKLKFLRQLKDRPSSGVIIWIPLLSGRVFSVYSVGNREKYTSILERFSCLTSR